MHALVVDLSADPARADQVVRHLRQDVVAWAERQRGFVSGQWLLTKDGTAGLGVVVFASEADVEAAAAGPRRYLRDGSRAWNIERVTVYEQQASA